MPLTSTQKNVLANFAGSGAIAAMNLLFVPLFLHRLGLEGYGLIGFFSTLTNALVLLDAGVATAVTRELASLSATPTQDTVKMRGVVRTLELLFWASSFFVGSLFFALAPQIADHWLKITAETRLDTILSLRLMGGTLLLHWPISFYMACLLGLQRQIRMNALLVVSNLLRLAGAALAITYVSSTVVAFFAWHLLAAGVSVIGFRVFLYRGLSPAPGARPSWAFVKNMFHFSLGVGGINLLSLCLTQMDKIILSAILPLKQFGAYVLAWTVAGVLLRGVGPIFNAVYPRFVQLVERRENDKVVEAFDRSAQLMSAVIVPLGIYLVAFSHRLLWVWSGDRAIAESADLLLSILAAGAVLNAFLHVPYGLLLSKGWTKIPLIQNTVAVVLMGPLIYLAATRMGLMAAALIWPLMNLAFLGVTLFIALPKTLPGFGRTWILRSVANPLVISITVAGALALLFQQVQITHRFRESVLLLIGALLMVIATGLGLPSIRRELLLRFRKGPAQIS